MPTNNTIVSPRPAYSRITGAAKTSKLLQPAEPMTFHLGEEAIGGSFHFQSFRIHIHFFSLRHSIFMIFALRTGFAAGIVGTLLGFPLDLVKTRQGHRHATCLVLFRVHL
jgi:hypothetical protein